MEQVIDIQHAVTVMVHSCELGTEDLFWDVDWKVQETLVSPQYWILLVSEHVVSDLAFVSLANYADEVIPDPDHTQVVFIMPDHFFISEAGECSVRILRVDVVIVAMAHLSRYELLCGSLHIQVLWCKGREWQSVDLSIDLKIVAPYIIVNVLLIHEPKQLHLYAFIRVLLAS